MTHDDAFDKYKFEMYPFSLTRHIVGILLKIHNMQIYKLSTL